MINRRDKHSQNIVKAAVNLTIKKNYESAAKLMFASGIEETTIERILYEPQKVRSSDLDYTLHLSKSH